MLMTMNLKLLLGSSARTETRSRRLATVTLLTFAQATVGLSALAQLPPPIVSHCFCCCVRGSAGCRAVKPHASWLQDVKEERVQAAACTHRTVIVSCI